MNILAACSIAQDALVELRAQHDVVVAVDAPAAELRRLIADRHAVIVRSGVQITGALMQSAPDLRLVIRAGSGLDNIDLDYLRENGIPLFRIPEPGARAVAELGFAMMLSLSRQVAKADRLLRAGHWAKHEINGHLLAGKTLGILGCGNIGTQVGRMGHAWNMDVLGCVEHPSADRETELARAGIQIATLPDLLRAADYLSVHVPLTDATRNLLDAEALAAMKPGAFLINLSRGGVVDEAALLRVLQSGHLRGAGLDVHEREGHGEVSLLADLENVLLTPHMGAGTMDTQKQIGQRILEIVRTQAEVFPTTRTDSARPRQTER